MKRGTLRGLRLSLLAAASLLAVGIAETIVTLTDADWELVEDNLYFQSADSANHWPVHDVDTLFRLRTDSEATYGGPYGSYTVRVNHLGHRGRARVPEKSDGTFRVACLGGSNVYGAGVQDSLTWPARLEARLTDLDPATRYEVWNLGVSGYTGTQMAGLGREMCERYDPDLLIIAPSNMGARPLLLGTVPRPLFHDFPRCWQYMLGLDHEPGAARRWALTHVRSYRLAELTLAIRRGTPAVPLWVQGSEVFEAENLASIRSMVEDHRQQVRMCVFILPAARSAATLGLSPSQLEDPLVKYGPVPDYVPRLDLLERYAEGLDSYYLDAAGQPAEYSEIHPPAHVLDWYAEHLAAWLIDRGLVPSPAGQPASTSNTTIQPSNRSPR